MALRVFDGFDHYHGNNYPNIFDIETRLHGMLSWVGSGGVFDGVLTGRNGFGKAWSGNLTAILGQRVSSAFIGMSVFTGLSDIQFTFQDTLTPFFNVDISQPQIYVVFRARNFSIQVVRVNASFPFTTFTEVAVTKNNVWSANTWHFIEIWPVIDLVNGSIRVRIDQIDVLNVSGINTQGTANNTWDGIEFTGAQLWDDFYYADTTVGPGSNPCNTFLGDPRCYTTWPNSNAAVQFTPLAGANWQEVSEVGFDGDITYNYDHVAGHEDTFNVISFPSTLTAPLGLQITGAYRKDDAGLREIKQALKSGATEVYGTNYYLADGGYAFFTDLWATDPNNGDWTLSSLSAINIGYNVAV